MKEKIKAFINGLIYDEPREEEIPEPVIEKPEIVENITPAIFQKEEKKEVEEVKPKSTFITLEPEKKENEEQEIIQEDHEKEVIQPEVLPQEPEKKVEYEYHKSQVISPMFGIQNKEEPKPVRRRRPVTKVSDVKTVNNENKSYLGTVFSPVFGDKAATTEVPSDEISEEIASLTVEDFITRTERQPKAEIKEEPVTEEKKPEAWPQAVAAEKEIAEEKPAVEEIKETIPTLHNAWDIENMKQEIREEVRKPAEEYYENISLFDLEDEQ